VQLAMNPSIQTLVADAMRDLGIHLESSIFSAKAVEKTNKF
jgi:hypothetical protein